jgi:hypothetical protein
MHLERTESIEINHYSRTGEDHDQPSSLKGTECGFTLILDRIASFSRQMYIQNSISL